MLEHLIHLGEWAARWPGTAAVLGLGAAAAFWRQEQPRTAALAGALAVLPLALASGTDARFVLASGLLVLLATGALAGLRGLDRRRPWIVSTGLLLFAVLLLLHSWRAGGRGLVVGGGGTPGLAWLNAWSGTGLVLLVALLGLRAIPRPGARSPGLAVWGPAALGFAAAAGLLAWEGRPRAREASLVLGLILGAGLAAFPVWRSRRALPCAVLVVGGFALWSAVIRDGRGAGAYIHPEGVPVAPGVDYELIAQDLQLPSALALAPDGRVFVSEFVTDRIWVYALEAGAWNRQLFARWPRSSAELPEGRSSEAGLWGLALHPLDGSLYAMGIDRWAPEPGPDGKARGVSRILRFADEAGGDPPWKVVADELPAGSIHSGGALAFGPDGKLYASVGEGGAGGAGDASLLGVVLRLNDDGSTPDDNPSAGSPVFARGFRNPYGLSFSPSGALYATENGPDCCDRILRVLPGGDYGWRPGTSGADAVSPGSAPLFDSGSSRLGPTGLVVGQDTLWFTTWHTSALHRAALTPEGSLRDHRVVFEAPSARPPAGSAYPFAGGFTGLARGSDGQLWFTAVGALGRFR